MLNLCRYVALAMMLLSAVDLALNLYQAAGPWFAARPDAGENAGDSEPPEESDAKSPPLTAQAAASVRSIVNVLVSPLTYFCYGATLFVLVRIARDQAHDLATG